MKPPSPESARIQGLYVHVPFCDGKCRYCAFYSIPWREESADRYLDALATEFQLRVRERSAFSPSTIYIGGGTPTLLSDRQLTRLLEIIRPAPGSAAPIEWTVEANPGTITRSKLRLLRDAGVNRVSLGAQSFDDGALRRLGRRHTAADIRSAAAEVRTAGFTNFGLDLIACIPGLDREGWAATLDAAIRLEPAHVSVYALTAEEATRLSADIRSGRDELLDDAEQLAMLDLAEQALGAAGYARCEISNYARPGFECRHNVSAWRGGEYLGVGPAAASHVGNRRWTNAPDLDAYLDAAASGVLPPCEEETLSPVTLAAERLVFGLRMAEGVDLAVACACPAMAGSPRIGRWETALQDLGKSGLVARAGARWRLTARGRHMADYVGAAILGA